MPDYRPHVRDERGEHLARAAQQGADAFGMVQQLRRQRELEDEQRKRQGRFDDRATEAHELELRRAGAVRMPNGPGIVQQEIGPDDPLTQGIRGNGTGLGFSQPADPLMDGVRGGAGGFEMDQEQNSLAAGIGLLRDAGRPKRRRPAAPGAFVPGRGFNLSGIASTAEEEPAAHRLGMAGEPTRISRPDPRYEQIEGDLYLDTTRTPEAHKQSELEQQILLLRAWKGGDEAAGAGYAARNPGAVDDFINPDVTPRRGTPEYEAMIAREADIEGRARLRYREPREPREPRTTPIERAEQDAIRSESLQWAIDTFGSARAAIPEVKKIIEARKRQGKDATVATQVLAELYGHGTRERTERQRAIEAAGVKKPITDIQRAVMDELLDGRSQAEILDELSANNSPYFAEARRYLSMLPGPKSLNQREADD